MFWWKRKRPTSDIPPEVRDELESHGEAAVSVALTHPLDVSSSPLHLLRYEHKQHALAWLKERRDVAEKRRRFLRNIAIAGVGLSALALLFSMTSTFYAKLNFDANRPTLVLEFPRLNWSSEVKATICVAFENIGTRPAVDVTAVLGSTNSEATTVFHLARLGPVGNPIYADRRPLVSNVDIDPGKLQDFLVVCVSYGDPGERKFADLLPFSFIGWPPADNVPGREFLSSPATTEMYQRMVNAEVCRKLRP